MDYRRLGKQRVEAMQLLNVIELWETGALSHSKKPGWINHPAAVMWRHYKVALQYYLKIMIEEWISQGYKNTMSIPSVTKSDVITWPWWLGLKKFHSSHRSNLLLKDPTFYGKFNWKESPGTPYWWPQATPPKNWTPVHGLDKSNPRSSVHSRQAS